MVAPLHNGVLLHKHPIQYAQEFIMYKKRTLGMAFYAHAGMLLLGKESF